MLERGQPTLERGVELLRLLGLLADQIPGLGRVVCQVVELVASVRSPHVLEPIGLSRAESAVEFLAFEPGIALAENRERGLRLEVLRKGDPSGGVVEEAAALHLAPDRIVADAGELQDGRKE